MCVYIYIYIYIYINNTNVFFIFYIFSKIQKNNKIEFITVIPREPLKYEESFFIIINVVLLNIFVGNS